MKKLMRKLMLSCVQATFLVTKEMSGTITFWEKIKMQLHLMVCKYCRLFKKQSRFIDDNVEQLHQDSSKYLLDRKLDDTKKAAMDQAMQAELNKNSDKN